MGAADATEGLRDIKAPIEVAPDLSLGLIAAVVLLTLLILFLAWRWARQRRRRAPTVAAPLPHIVASKQLAILSAGIERGQAAKTLAFGLSELLRQYYEGQTGVPATLRTIEELEGELSVAKGWAEPLQEELLQILRSCDLVKFSDFSLSITEQQNLCAAVSQLIRATIPVNPESTNNKSGSLP